MKKTILISLPIFAVILSSCFLVSCGGGSGTSKANTTNNSTGGSNSNSSSSSSSVQINQGQVAVYNSEVTSINDVSVLNINTVFETGDKSQIDSLQMCNEKKCWTLIDSKSKNSKKLSHKFTAKKLTENKSSQKIGSFAIPEDGIVVDRLKYIYKGKKGEIKLDDPINLNKSSARDIYLNAGEDVSVALSSISVPFGENILYLHKVNFEHEFKSGLIIKVPKGSTKRNAVISISNITDPQSTEPVLSHSIAFLSMSKLDFDKNQIPNKLEKEIEVYMPILKSFNSNNYQLRIEEDIVEIIPYEIRKIDNKSYIFFRTNKNIINADFRRRITLSGE